VYATTPLHHFGFVPSLQAPLESVAGHIILKTEFGVGEEGLITGVCKPHF
jgi:hypothetical protein